MATESGDTGEQRCHDDVSKQNAEKRSASTQSGKEPGPYHSRNVPHLGHRSLGGLCDAERTPHKSRESDNEPDRASRLQSVDAVGSRQLISHDRELAER